MLAQALFWLANTVLPWVPRPLAYAGAGVVARVLATSNPPALRHACANQAVVQRQRPDAPSVRRAARLALRRQALNYVDLFQLRRLSAAAILQRVQLQGYDHLHQAQQAGRGVIVVSAHLGNLDVVGQALALRGQRVLVPVERIRPPGLFEYVCRLRARFGLRLVPAEKALRPALRALRQGEIVVLIADWDMLGNGVPVHFFGMETRLPPGPALLHLRSGAPIVPCFVHRRPGGRYVAWAEPPLPVLATGDFKQDLPAIMQQVANALAAAVERSSDQWVLFHSVWSEHVSPESPATGRSARHVSREA